MAKSKIMRILSKEYGEVEEDFEDRYMRMVSERQYALGRARACDKFARTDLLPIRGDGGEYRYEFNAETRAEDGYALEPIVPIAVQSLAGTMGEAFMNRSVPFFSLTPPAEYLKKENEKIVQDAIAELASTAGISEQEMSSEIQQDPELAARFQMLVSSELAKARTDRMNDTNALFDFYKRTVSRDKAHNRLIHYLVTGCFIVYKETDVTTEEEATKKSRLIPMHRIVLEMDENQEPVEFIFTDRYRRSTLPPDIRDYVRRRSGESKTVPGNGDDIVVYTMVRFEGSNTDRKFHIEREYDREIIPDSYRTGPAEDCPFILVTSNASEHNKYGASYTSLFLQQFVMSSHINQDMLDIVSLASFGTVLASKDAFETGAMQSMSEMRGQVIPIKKQLNGASPMIQTLTFEVENKLSALLQLVDKSQSIIREAFNMNKSIQRSGDRVTKEEILTMTEDIRARTTVHTNSLEPKLLYPDVRLTYKQALKCGVLPKRPYMPVISIGVETMDSESNLGKLLQSIQVINELIQGLHPVLLQTLSLSSIIEMFFAASGFNPLTYIDAEATVQGMKAQLQAAAAAQPLPQEGQPPQQ